MEILLASGHPRFGSDNAALSCGLAGALAEDVRAAFFSKSKDRIRLDDSEGRIAGDPVVPYPPGVPLLYFR